jgi:hypothetical protein
MIGNDIDAVVKGALENKWSLIPTGPEKKPLIKSWKEFQFAPASPEQIEKWVWSNPSGLGIVTGAISGVIVLDFDGEQGNAAMHALGLEPHVRTGSGGHHVYLKHPGWPVPTVNGKAKRELGATFPGIDIRGDGGYAICAGRATSGEYVWLRDMVPDSLDVLPDEVRAAFGLLIPPPPPCAKATGRDCHSDKTREAWAGKVLALAFDRISLHGRNNVGFWLACQLRDNGFSQEDAETVISEYAGRVPPANAKGEPEPYTIDEARTSVRQAFSKPPREPWSGGATDAFQSGSLPTVEVSNRELRDVSNDAFAAVRARNNPPSIFVRSGQMVRVESDEKGRYAFREVSPDFLRGRFTRSANFRRFWSGRDGQRHEVATSPPLDAVRDVLAQPSTSWGLPPIESITGVPLIRPDGTVIATPGYDPSTWVIYVPSPGFQVREVPEQPTADEVARAIGLLNEMYGGFPFVDDASRANMFALLLTMIVRRAIRGNVPIALIDAPAAGTGKSLLAETVALIITGTNAVMQPAPSRDEEELRKLLTAVLSAGYPLSIFDNAAFRIESPNLARAVTAATWSDRILGQSKTIDLPQQTVWVITGNNITLGGDIPRRSYWIRLDAKEPQPWQRTGFKIANLQEWILERRPELVAALLTVARSWYAAGKPAGGAQVLGSFEEWSRTLGGILRHVGVAGFLENLQELYEQSDPTEGQWQAFLDRVHCCYDGDTFLVVDLVRHLRLDMSFHSMLPDDLIDDDRNGSNLFQRKVGNAFRQRVDRRYGPYGVHLLRAGQDRSTKTVRWRVEYQTTPPSDYWPPAPPAQPPAPFAPPPGYFPGPKL